jgi:hypothetical protein
MGEGRIWREGAGEVGRRRDLDGDPTAEEEAAARERRRRREKGKGGLRVAGVGGRGASYIRGAGLGGPAAVMGWRPSLLRREPNKWLSAKIFLKFS